MAAANERIETFAVEDDCLVRRVVPRRGTPYEHRCPLAVYRELAWAALDLAADGFTLETLADRVRERADEEDDVLPARNAQARPWASTTHAAVAIAFWKERGLLDVRRRRNHVEDGYFFEDAMISYYVLASND